MRGALAVSGKCCYAAVLTLCFSKRSLLRPADMSTRRASECAPKCALRLLRREDATLGLSFTALPPRQDWSAGGAGGTTGETLEMCPDKAPENTVGKL